MFTYVLYGLATVLLAVSMLKDGHKTRLALKKSWMMLLNLLPQMAALFVFVGIVLAIVNEEVISSLIGQQSGVFGVVIASVVGAITLIPGFVAFPLAANLLDHGAGIPQIAALVSSMMMVGVATFAMEAKTVGRKVAFLRNGMAFVYSFFIAGIMSLLMESGML